MLSRVFAALGIGVWSFLALSAAMALATSPGSWIVAIAIGVVAPAILMTQVNRSISLYEERGRTMPSAGDREGELLRVFEARGGVTPAFAAMRTSLTVDEASKMLEKLAAKGHLKVLSHDGSLTYSLFEREAVEAPESSPEPLPESLSERELEVLALLASGKSNREIAKDLFVAIGTVKAHANNIYRKLGARNRAEALARSRALELV